MPSDQHNTDGDIGNKPRINWYASHPKFFDMRLSHWVQIVLTASLAALACAQWIVYNRQAKIMVAQTGIADTANKLTQSIQRAFINVNDLRIETVAAGAKWRLTPAIENSGNTPTKSFEMVVVGPKTQWMVRLADDINEKERNNRPPIPGSVAIDEDYVDWKLGAPPDPDSIFKLLEAKLSKALFYDKRVLGPKAMIYPYIASEEMKKDDVIKAATSRSGIGKFFFGSIHYTDIFDERHTTKYCFRIDAFQSDMETPIVLTCRYWNCTDQTCDPDEVNYQREWAAIPKSIDEERYRKSEPPNGAK